MSSKNFLIPNQQKYVKFQQWKRRQKLKAELNEQREQQQQQQIIPKLPVNFADDLFNLEMEIETEQFTITTVKRLLELYKIGTEYFHSLKSEKYLVFKNKSQMLLINPKVQSMVESRPSFTEESPKKNKSLTEVEPVSQEFKLYANQKKKEIENSVHVCQSYQSNVNNLIIQSKEENEKINELLRQQLEQQDEVLQNRLKQRKRQSLKV